MAIFAEGGTGSSIKHISRSDNRGAGSSINHALVAGKVKTGHVIKVFIKGAPPVNCK